MQIPSSKILNACSIEVTNSIKMGQEILREMNQDFSKVISPSKLALRYDLNKDISEKAPCAKLLYDLALFSSEKLEKLEKKLPKNMFKLPDGTLNLEAYIKKLVKMVQSSSLANCGEHSEIMQYKLFQKHKDAKIISMIIKNQDFSTNYGRLCRDHEFVVSDLALNSDLSKPETWGENAVIYDSWAGIVDKAQVGLEKLKQIFNFKPDSESITIVENCSSVPLNKDKFLKIK